jgi:hypothetical protein
MTDAAMISLAIGVISPQRCIVNTSTHTDSQCPSKPVVDSWAATAESVTVCDGWNVEWLPNAKPSDGEKNLVPKVVKAPETGNIADISPLWV